MRRWAAAVLVLLLLSTWAWGVDVTGRQAEELETDKLEEMTEGYLDQEFSEDIDLNAGDAEANVWTDDLTHEYVHINADYES